MARPDSAAALPAMDHPARRDRLRTLIGDAGCDALLVTRPVDVRYLTGFMGSNGAVIVGPDAADDVLVTDARYRERVGDVDIARVELTRRVEAVAAGIADRRLGVDADHVTLAAAAGLEAARGGRAVVATSGLVAGLRSEKDAGEIARLRLACAITADVLIAVAEAGIAPGTSELALARQLEAAMIARGADAIAFATIVAAGINGASPHHAPTGRRVETGELVTIDCGAEVDGYHADMTRTLPGGDPDQVSGRLVEIHGVVETANAAGRAAAGAGVPVADVDRAARAVVEAAGYGDAFVHPTGHGIGLEIHEAPLVTERSAASLAVGTAFTVEPGIYLPGIGGVRIEDSLVILPAGPDVMTVMERRFVGA
jgi:Xaa-Pro aminopeptidase